MPSVPFDLESRGSKMVFIITGGIHHRMESTEG
jgi:hypothetical protein